MFSCGSFPGGPATCRKMVVGVQGISQLELLQASMNWTDINFERVEHGLHGEADHLGQGHTQKMLHHETCKKKSFGLKTLKSLIYVLSIVWAQELRTMHKNMST